MDTEISVYKNGHTPDEKIEMEPILQAIHIVKRRNMKKTKKKKKK